MAKRVRGPVAAWLACAGALVLLTLVAYGVGHAQRLDATALSDLSVPGGSTAGSLAEAVAFLADPLPLLLILAALCGIALRRGRPLDAAAAITVVVGANLTTQILKMLLAHPRYQPVLGWDQIDPVAFPSGHATAAASIAVAFALVVPRARRRGAVAVGTGFVLAVGCSVVALGWHYPSDVVGGVLVAVGWGFAVVALLRVAAPRPASPPDQLARRAAISVK
jgi:membrane-associated phospholipid phosphatase